MRKERLVKCIEDGLKHILSLKPGVSNDNAVNAAVEKFVAEEVSRFSASELLSNFDTMEKGLTRFLDFLEHQDLVTSAAPVPLGRDMQYYPEATGYPAAAIATDMYHHD